MKKKAKRGRKPKELKPGIAREAEALASYGLRDDQIAEFFEISEATLKRRVPKELRRGRIKGSAQLMQHAHRRALVSDTMLIFLLKTRCGMQEKNNFAGDLNVSLRFAESPD